MLFEKFIFHAFLNLLVFLANIVPFSSSAMDCYFEKYATVEERQNYSKACTKEGFVPLPDIFKEEVYHEEEKADSEVYQNATLNRLCCPSDKSTDERGLKNRPFLWPNELKGTLSRAFMTCHATQIPGLDSIRFLLYTTKTLGLFDFEEIYVNDLNTLQHSGFIRDAPVKIIIHGFMSSAFVGPAPTLRAAYAKMPDRLNILAVHWEPLANVVTASDGICYDIASKSTKHVGRKTAEMIEFLIKSNFTSLNRIHVLGHSLGSHCAGFTGKFLKIGKLPRLTAFDPARPGFSDRPASERLDYTDAEFVDVLHTATKQWKLLGTISFGFLPFPVGIKEPLGHSDFYPNHGTHQPGCVLQLQKLPALCSHSRSYYYFADSIRYRDERLFLSTECNSLENLEKGICSSEESLDNTRQVIMGEYTQTDNLTRRIFYVKTNARSPFPITIISNNGK